MKRIDIDKLLEDINNGKVKTWEDVQADEYVMSDVVFLKITQRPNQFEETPDGIKIYLTQGQACLIDAADYEWAKRFRWHVQERKGIFYAVTTVRTIDGKITSSPLHRILMGLLPFDKRRALHKNGNSLDNRRSNLVIATHKEIMLKRKKAGHTSSRFVGVYWHKLSQKWQAYIVVNGVTHYLGLFKSDVDAARAYNEMSRYFYGEAGRINRRKVAPKQ